METLASTLIRGIAVGLGATVVMDLWNLFLNRAFGIPSLNYCFLGRWVRGIPNGILQHTSIAAAPPRPHECATGWIAHYSIGTGLAIAFVLIFEGWLARPTLLAALLFGIGTVVFPFLILQPALGFGVAGSRTQRPGQARLKSLATHTVFGIGLYVSGLALSRLV